MSFGNFYENGYGFVVHNLQTKISGKLLLYLHGDNSPQRTRAQSWESKAYEVGGYAAEDQKQYELPAWINHNWSVHVNR